ncbi:hypothetical protein B0H16DRAFT_162078 [Mycena metata]|uniref:Uncharacterized protein n=1 Tax=Mycena metata TaxID=1033252 RepID=A0AAD7I465_9AGAR|nr:hypothetical protein B0H16DRAFT_162078 [Mycena metata]
MYARATHEPEHRVLQGLGSGLGCPPSRASVFSLSFGRFPFGALALRRRLVKWTDDDRGRGRRRRWRRTRRATFGIGVGNKGWEGYAVPRRVFFSSHLHTCHRLRPFGITVSFSSSASLPFPVFLSFYRANTRLPPGLQTVPSSLRCPCAPVEGCGSSRLVVGGRVR